MGDVFLTGCWPGRRNWESLEVGMGWTGTGSAKPGGLIWPEPGEQWCNVRSGETVCGPQEVGGMELGCEGMWEVLEDLGKWGVHAGFKRELGTAWGEGQTEGSAAIVYKGK